MKIGSVSFFKRVIIITIALLILVPTALSVGFGIKSHRLEAAAVNSTNELAKLKAQLSEVKDELESTSSKLQEKTDEFEDQLDPEGYIPKEGDEQNIPDIAIDYQQSYPQMYVYNTPKAKFEGEKTVYLTFDDGPSQNTLQVLDILDEYEIKATFFVVYKNDEFSNSVYREIVNRGHQIAVHSTSHDYKKIYSSVQAFLDDFNIIYNHIYDVTGYETHLFRFPGGSINSYNDGIYMELIAEMTRRGFTYHDWNVSGQDASQKATEESIYTAVTTEARRKDKSIVLLHDSSGKGETVKALPRIIEDLKNDGYVFERIENSVAPFVFSYIKPE